MAENAGNPQDDTDVGPSQAKRICPLLLTIDGRTYSRSHSYRLRKEERDREAEKCRARAEKVRKNL